MQNSTKPARRGPRLLLAVFLGVAAAAGVYLYVSNVQQGAQRAASCGPAGNGGGGRGHDAGQGGRRYLDARGWQPAHGGQYHPARRPVRGAGANAATALSDVQGKALTVPVAAGQQILTQYLATPDQPDVKKFADLVPAGKRAMSVTFTELSTAVD